MYKQRIAAAIGTADLPTLFLVEDIMRNGRTGLDGLSGPEFVALARQSYRDAQLMAEAGKLRQYCDALGLKVPARFAGPR